VRKRGGPWVGIEAQAVPAQPEVAVRARRPRPLHQRAVGRAGRRGVEVGEDDGGPCGAHHEARERQFRQHPVRPHRSP
jgi:hypothetical protein